MGLLFIVFMEERECVEKIVKMKDVLVSTFSFLNARETPPKFTYHNKGFINYISAKTGLSENLLGPG